MHYAIPVPRPAPRQPRPSRNPAFLARRKPPTPQRVPPGPSLRERRAGMPLSGWERTAGRRRPMQARARRTSHASEPGRATPREWRPAAVPGRARRRRSRASTALPSARTAPRSADADSCVRRCATASPVVAAHRQTLPALPARSSPRRRWVRRNGARATDAGRPACPTAVGPERRSRRRGASRRSAAANRWADPAPAEYAGPPASACRAKPPATASRTRFRCWCHR